MRTIKIKPIHAYLASVCVPMETVLRHTAELYSIPVELLTGRRTEWRIEWPRLVARAVAVELGTARAAVAKHLKCDRASVGYAIQSVRAAREAYPKVNKEISDLIVNIRSAK